MEPASARQIYNSPALDVIYPSVYNFYWDDANVAYTLAQTDLNLQLVNSEAGAQARPPVLLEPAPRRWRVAGAGGRVCPFATKTFAR